MRLWAPAHVARAYPEASTFLIDVGGGGDRALCAVVDERGLMALVVEEGSVNEVQDRAAVARMLGIQESQVPCLLLVRSSSGSAGWRNAEAFDEMSSRRNFDAGTARLIVESIRSYYAVQVLEPSVKGFLRILSLQFPRNDLYLFELLQNAVDDGARNVSFRYLRASQTLRVWHDGRRFNPLDVLGLASVGLSTKAKKKRTVGFMGVGFKACYKRYSEVTVSDGLFRFRFQRPAGSGGAGNDYAWVMLPDWVESDSTIGARGGDATALKQSGAIAMGPKCCCFDLRKCTAGPQAPIRDLAYLPLTAPPLLGRTALERSGVKPSSAPSKSSETSACWNLDWGGRSISVRRELLSLGPDPDSSFSMSTSNQSGEVVVVSEKGKDSRWAFLSDTFSPGSAARQTYELHTKKTTSGVAMRESVYIFFRMSSVDGSPIPPRYSTGKQNQRPRKTSSSGAGALPENVGRGRIHAVLPTKLATPFGFHVQGNWLLSVDRTDMQDSFENPWNRSLLERLPDLVLSYLRWIAAASHKFGQRASSYAMLPEFSNACHRRLRQTLRPINSP